MVAPGIGVSVNLARERIESARRRVGRTDDVRVVAAVKYLETGRVPDVVAAGVRDLGENRLDSLKTRRATLDLGEVCWHFIGRLQSRKTPAVAAEADWVHSLCTASAARALQAHHERTGSQLPQLLIEVNVGRDPSKDGIPPEELAAFVESLGPAVASQVRGLMTMPPLAASADDNRSAFSALRELAEEASGRFVGLASFDELSMGTSQDFEVAVEEGATLVRLGRVLYAADKTG